jgi:hypothetical protein
VAESSLLSTQDNKKESHKSIMASVRSAVSLQDSDTAMRTDYTSLSGLTAGKPPGMPLHVRNPHTTVAQLRATFSGQIEI